MRFPIAAALGAVFSWAAPAAAHEWIEANDFRNASGVLCCNRSDCTPVAHAVVWQAGVGSRVEVPLPSGAETATINIVHASRDPEGRSFACTTGCLFRVPGS